MSINEKLMSEGIKVNYSLDQQKVRCPKCSHTRKNSSEPCLSVSIDNEKALWRCHHCEWEGSAFSDNETKTFRKAEVVPIKSPKLPEDKKLSDNALSWLGSRNISIKTAQDFGLYTHNGSLCFPYYLDNEVVNVKYRTSNKEFRQEKNSLRTLYNIDNVKKYWEETNKKEIIFVEGEMDVLALYDSNFTNVCSLPDGAPKEPKFKMNDKRFFAFEQSQWIFDAEQVIIATDNDQAGDALKLELLHRFGRDICKVVHFPKYNDKQLKDANEVLIHLGADKLKECIYNAEEFPIKDIHTANEYKNVVQNIYDGNVQRAFSTGYEKLDEIYKIMPSTFNLVTGIPNHGKSNFLDQILMNLAEQQDFKFIVYSPEHSTPNHLRRLLEKRCRKPFDIGPYPRISQEELNSGMDFLDRHFKFIENSDDIPTIDYILAKTKVAKLRYGIHGLIIDPFNQVSATRENNKREDEHIRDIIAKCQQFARNHQIVVWMVAHPHKLSRNDSGVIPPPDLYQVSGSAHWANMADVGIVIHRDFEENKTTIITRKIREQGVYGEIGSKDFFFNYKTRCYE